MDSAIEIVVDGFLNILSHKPSARFVYQNTKDSSQLLLHIPYIFPSNLGQKLSEPESFQALLSKEGSLVLLHINLAPSVSLEIPH